MKWLLFIFLILFLNACNSKDEEPSLNFQNQTETDENIDDKNELAIETSTNAKALAPEILVSCLPDKIVGFDAITPTTGTIHEDGYDVTMARAQYEYMDRIITIEIFDYIKLEYIPNYHLFYSPPTISDYETKLLSGENYVAYMLINEIEMAGRLRALAFDRFYITIRLDESDELAFNLEKYFNLINFRKLKR